ncbi:MAG: hypothetical protein RJQ09_08330 [Cyclobacteriaceae bacterium]
MLPFLKNSFSSKVSLLVAILALAFSVDSEAQLLEDNDNRLKTEKRASPGFLFFKKKTEKRKPGDKKRIKKEGVNVKYSQPVNYSNKERFFNAKYSTPVTYSKKERLFNAKYSQPVTYSRKERFFNAKYSLPVIYSPKERNIKVKYSKAPFNYKYKIKPKYSQPIKENFFTKRIALQQRLKNLPAPTPDARPLYGKKQFALPYINFSSKKLSITGSMQFKKHKLADQFRPLPIGSSYQGDNKVFKPFIAIVLKRMGQWERSHYQGRQVGWSKFGKRTYLKQTSNLVAQHQGYIKVPTPFFDNIYKKVGNWEQSNYKGRSVGWSKFGKEAFLKQRSSTMANYEGGIKIKKPGHKHLHPSVAYIEGKKFSNNNWKERWRKLHIFWVRLNPGKEKPHGLKENVKIKSDKDEKDIWSY